VVVRRGSSGVRERPDGGDAGLCRRGVKYELSRRLTRMNADKISLFESAFIRVHPRQ
jgi:hypothetical protein